MVTFKKWEPADYNEYSTYGGEANRVLSKCLDARSRELGASMKVRLRVQTLPGNDFVRRETF